MLPFVQLVAASCSEAERKKGFFSISLFELETATMKQGHLFLLLHFHRRAPSLLMMMMTIDLLFWNLITTL